VSGGRWHGEDDVERRLPRRGEDGIRATMLSELEKFDVKHFLLLQLLPILHGF
jgi:hypothetical protein